MTSETFSGGRRTGVLEEDALVAMLVSRVELTASYGESISPDPMMDRCKFSKHVSVVRKENVVQTGGISV